MTDQAQTPNGSEWRWNHEWMNESPHEAGSLHVAQVSPSSPATALAAHHDPFAEGQDDWDSLPSDGWDVKADTVEQPPDYKPAAKRLNAPHCGSCLMYNAGKCWGYGNKRVKWDYVCDSYSPSKKREAATTGTTYDEGHPLGQIAARHPNVDLFATEHPEGLRLKMIQVAPEHQRQGYAGAALQDLLSYADQQGKPVALNPGGVEDRPGMSEGGIRNWYKSYGFVPNKGRNKDYAFTEAMIRPADNSQQWQVDQPQTGTQEVDTTTSSFAGDSDWNLTVFDGQGSVSTCHVGAEPDELFIALNVPKPTADEIFEWAKKQDWPKGTELENPSEYHITLLYSPKGHKEHREAEWWATDNSDGIEVKELDEFPSQERGELSAFVLRVDTHDDEIKTRMERLLDKAEDEGVEVNRYPGGSKPHITVAYGPKLPKGIKTPDITFSSDEAHCGTPRTSSLVESSLGEVEADWLEEGEEWSVVASSPQDERHGANDGEQQSSGANQKLNESHENEGDDEKLTHDSRLADYNVQVPVVTPNQGVGLATPHQVGDLLSLQNVAHNLHYKFEQSGLDPTSAQQYASRLLQAIGYTNPDQPTIAAAIQAWQTMYPDDSRALHMLPGQPTSHRNADVDTSEIALDWRDSDAPTSSEWEVEGLALLEFGGLGASQRDSALASVGDEWSSHGLRVAAWTCPECRTVNDECECKHCGHDIHQAVPNVAPASYTAIGSDRTPRVATNQDEAQGNDDVDEDWPFVSHQVGDHKSSGSTKPDDSANSVSQTIGHPPILAQTMYHWAPRAMRDQIAQQGLRAAVPENDEYVDYSNPEAYKGVYLFNHPPAYTPGGSKGFYGDDLWAVDTHGLNPQADEGEWDASMVPHDIEPTRLQFLNSPAHRKAWEDYQEAQGHYAAKPKKVRKTERPQKCKKCKQPATKSLIWAEGIAYVPVCDKHEQQVRKELGEDEVCGVHTIRKEAGSPQTIFSPIRAIVDQNGQVHTFNDGHAPYSASNGIDPATNLAHLQVHQPSGEIEDLSGAHSPYEQQVADYLNSSTGEERYHARPNDFDWVFASAGGAAQKSASGEWPVTHPVMASSTIRSGNREREAKVTQLLPGNQSLTQSMSSDDIPIIGESSVLVGENDVKVSSIGHSSGESNTTESEFQPLRGANPLSNHPRKSPAQARTRELTHSPIHSFTQGGSPSDELHRFVTADSWDTRQWPDPMSDLGPRPVTDHAKQCTCKHGDKLHCPVHGLEANGEVDDMAWSIPEGSPVGYPQDQPRQWTQAVSALASSVTTEGRSWTPVISSTELSQQTDAKTNRQTNESRAKQGANHSGESDEQDSGWIDESHASSIADEWPSHTFTLSPRGVVPHSPSHHHGHEWNNRPSCKALLRPLGLRQSIEISDSESGNDWYPSSYSSSDASWVLSSGPISDGTASVGPVQVVHVNHPEHEDGLHPNFDDPTQPDRLDHPVFYHPDSGTLYVGQPGGYHDTLSEHVPLDLGRDYVNYGRLKPAYTYYNPYLDEHQEEPTRIDWMGNRPENSEAIEHAAGATPSEYDWTFSKVVRPLSSARMADGPSAAELQQIEDSQPQISKGGVLPVPWEEGLHGKGLYFPEADHLVTWSDPRHHGDVWYDDDHYPLPGVAHHLDIEPSGLYRSQGAYNRQMEDNGEGLDEVELQQALQRHDPRLTDRDPGYEWSFDRAGRLNDEWERLGGPTVPATMNFTPGPAQNPMQPGPSPYANVRSWQINVGTDEAEHVQQWMMENFPDVPMRISPGLGAWEGQGEPSTGIVVYNTPPFKMRQIVQAYGEAHPQEDAFAVVPLPESRLVVNPSRGSAASALAGDEVGEDWAVPLSASEGPPGSQILASPRGEQDPLVSLWSRSSHDSSLSDWGSVRKEGHQLGWQPGEHGKGLVHNGEVHTWGTGAEEDGDPSHPEYASEHLALPEDEEAYLHSPTWDTAFSVNPQGHVNVYEPQHAEQLGPQIESADPRLKLNYNSDYDWDFATQPTRTEPDSEDEKRKHNVEISNNEPEVATTGA